MRILTTNAFEKDFKRMEKRGKNTHALYGVMQMLPAGTALPPRYRDHSLTGNYKARRECHIEPDWLLIYKPEADSIVFERTGSHSDLF